MVLSSQASRVIKLFKKIDLDGNGELELEEFRLAFTGLAAP